MSIKSSRIVRLLGRYHTEETVGGTNSVTGVGARSLVCMHRSVFIATVEDGAVTVIIMTNIYWALTACQAKCCVHSVWLNSFSSDPRGRYSFPFQLRAKEAHRGRRQDLKETLAGCFPRCPSPCPLCCWCLISSVWINALTRPWMVSRSSKTESPVKRPNTPWMPPLSMWAFSGCIALFASRWFFSFF